MDRPVPPGGARGRVARVGVSAPSSGRRGRDPHAHQRPKIERYDDTLFVVLRPARYVDQKEEVEFGEVHVFVGSTFVLTVRHSEAPEFSSVRRRLESEPELLEHGPEAVLYAVVDKVVDGYYPVVAGLANDIDEIEVEVFRGDPEVSRRIYELSGEVADFQRATRPLAEMIYRAVAPGSSSTRSTPSSSVTSATCRTTSRRSSSGWTSSAKRSETCSRSTQPSSRSNRTRRCAASARRATFRTRRSRRSPRGPRSCSPRRWSARCTA